MAITLAAIAVKEQSKIGPSQVKGVEDLGLCLQLANK